MKKNIVVFGVVLLFLALALTPTINSSFVNIKSEGEENKDQECIEVEVYDFKGKYGYENHTKKLTDEDFEIFQNELKSLKNSDMSLEDKIKQQIKFFKKYDLISQDYSYEYIEASVKEQKSYLQKMANIGKLYQIINKNDYDAVLNFLSFDLFYISNGMGVAIGFPPWKIIWGISLPYIPTFSFWATALIESQEPIIVETFGLLGYQDCWEAVIVAFLGFVGIVTFIPLVSPGSNQEHWIGIGLGFSGFCFAFG